MMLLAVIGSLGLALAVSGLPIWDNGRLERRVRPYVVGAHRMERKTFGWWGAKDADTRYARLAAAGSKLDPRGLLLQQVAAGTACCTIGLGLLFLMGGVNQPSDVASTSILIGILFVLGFLARDKQLSRSIARRRRSLAEALPAALDLLTIGVMSGLSVHESLDRAGRALGGPLGEEFRRVIGDIRSGDDIESALSALAARTGEPGLERMIGALCVALSNGTPVADVLAGQAGDLRSARRSELLEMGGRREILMLIPVVFLILPVVVLFALYPGLVTLDLLVP